jgi:hypothetical protein
VLERGLGGNNGSRPLSSPTSETSETSETFDGESEPPKPWESDFVSLVSLVGTLAAMYPALRSLPSCAPINRDHAREHQRKSELRFEVGNETRNPRRRGHVPIKYCGVACAQVAKKPNHKPGYVNSPADTFRFCHLPSPGLLPPSWSLVSIVLDER